MVLSMTGYGKSTGSFEGKKVIVEMRSLNSKSLDLNLRLPSIYREKELEMRAIISEQLDRGKVELSINIENSGESKATSINHDLAAAYYNDLKQLATSVGETNTDLLGIVMRMPDVFSTEKMELAEGEGIFILDLVKQACDQLNEFRKQEGDQLRKEFQLQIGTIARLLTEVPSFEQERIQIVRERMKTSLEKITNVAVDGNRFEQELIFYIEKMDISEEKMRLSNHLDYYLQTMDVPSCGKKLGFISQEIGREINTLGSKSYHVEMQKIVVEMKDHLEKIKEQILNTL